MKITIWSDFVCPFCYIGDAHLKQALEKFEHRDEVEVTYKSFLLMPGAEYKENLDYYESFAESKNTTVENAKGMTGQVQEMASQAGLKIDFDTAKFSGTDDAHRVFQFAKEEGKGNEFFHRFYKAHFTEGLLISDPSIIINLSQEVGLDVDRVKEILNSDEYIGEFRSDYYGGQANGIQGVPFFVIDEKYAVQGAQPVETFVNVLNQVWDKDYAQN